MNPKRFAILIARSASLMVLLSLLSARAAFAQSYPITFDATALDAARFNVDFNAVGRD